MKRFSYIIALFISCVAISLQAQPLQYDVRTINDKQSKSCNKNGEFVDEMKYMIQLNNKYALNKWYCDASQFASQQGEFIDFGGVAESNIRPTSHTVFSLATSLRYDIYSKKVAGISKKKAFEILERLIKSSAYRHKSNNADIDTAWGDAWQSALWASQIATGAWLVWDDLSTDTQSYVLNMMVHEADRFIDYQVPYYRDLSGKILFPGDTKAEENAWNSNVLTIALAMLPNHPNYDRWMQSNIMLQLSAFAIADDCRSERIVDGYKLCEVLKGSNMNADGTVINHKIIHPDYMTTIMHNVVNASVFAMAGVTTLDSSTRNGDLVYQALTLNKYNGKTMYQPTADNKASAEIFFPQGNDWGGERQANYWLMDIMADANNWGGSADISPMDWAKVRNKEMLRMMNRDTTGQYYQSKKEDNFFSREQWIGFHLAWGYILYCNNCLN